MEENEDSVRASPFLDEESRAKIVQPVCRASPRIVHSFAAKLKRSQSKKIVDWPFHITRRTPAFVWREEGVAKALVHMPVTNQPRGAGTHHALVPGMPNARIKWADPILSRLETVGELVRSWMFALYRKDLSIVNPHACLIDLEANGSMTHCMWRAMQTSAPIQIDLACTVFE